jgi:rhodanese-related sulfurtransferase
MNLPWWLLFGRVPEISASELSDMQKDGGAQLIDVRTPLEFAVGHLTGARNVPIYRFQRALPSLELDPNRPIVAICATAHRSLPAVRLLRAAGYKNVVQLKGGMLNWYASGLPTTRE